MSNSLNIISANNLRSGLNVYFSQNEGQNKGEPRWESDSSLATAYSEDQLPAAFERAKQDMENNIVVDCVTVPVDDNHNPITVREKIRAAGPSVKYGK